MKQFENGQYFIFIFIFIFYYCENGEDGWFRAVLRLSDSLFIIIIIIIFIFFCEKLRLSGKLRRVEEIFLVYIFSNFFFFFLRREII